MVQLKLLNPDIDLIFIWKGLHWRKMYHPPTMMIFSFWLIFDALVFGLDCWCQMKAGAIREVEEAVNQRLF
jgi:hypothetical protein